MCAGAIALARISRLYFGAPDPKGGAVLHGPRLFAQPTCHHAPEVYPGIGEGEAGALLRAFFRERRLIADALQGRPARAGAAYAHSNPFPGSTSLIILLLVALNGVFAMSELAIVSSRKPRLKAMARAGRRGAQTALDLAADPGRFLSTVQIGITLIGILAGAYSGASLGGPVGAAPRRCSASRPIPRRRSASPWSSSSPPMPRW